MITYIFAQILLLLCCTSQHSSVMVGNNLFDRMSTLNILIQFVVNRHRWSGGGGVITALVIWYIAITQLSRKSKHGCYNSFTFMI